MSVSGKLVLAIKMLLESQEYKAELNQAVSDTQQAAAKVEGSTKGMGTAVQAAVQGQSAAVRGAAGALVSLGAVAGTAVVAAAAVGLAYHQAGQETLAFEKAIILTGNRAGVTSGQLADMARNIDGIAGTQANASAALAAITASGQVTRENLQKVGLAAVEMERATGQSVGETTQIFAELGKEPVKASLRLNESMNYLTAGTYAQIKAAEELGDKEAAASIAQNAAADALRDRAAKVEQHLGTLERAWRGVRDFAKEAWDAMLNVGRAETSGEKLDTVRKRIAELESKIAGNSGFAETNGGAATGRPAGTARMQVELQALQAQAAALEGVAFQASEAARTQAEKARVESAGIAAVNELGKANERAMTTQERANKALEKYRDNVKAARAAYEQNPTTELAAFLDPKTIEKAEAAILKTGKASKAALSDVEKLTQAGTALTASLLAQDSGLSGDFSKEWESLNAAYRAGKTSLEELTAAQAKLLSQQPLMKKAADEEAKATKELAKEREKTLATQDKELEKTLAAVVAQDEQNARLGLSKEAIAELDAAKLEMLATDMELQAANALFLNQDGEIYLALIKQANAYRDLARAKREGGARQAGIESAKEAEKEAKKAGDEWEKAGERIEQSLTDSLMRGFESGKTAAQNLRDTAENMFKTLVLRPTISAVMKPVAGFVQSIFDGGAGGAGGGGGGILGMAQQAYSLYNGYAGLTSGQGVMGSIGSWLGLGSGTGAGAGATAVNGLSALTPVTIPTNAAAVTGVSAGGGAGAGSLAGAGAFAAAAAVVLNAVGAFRSERKTGGGLRGTLGGGPLSAWEEWREGGTLFDGPSYDTFNPTQELDSARAKLAKAREAGDLRNVALHEMLVRNLEDQYSGLAEATAAQSKVIQTAYDAMRKSAGDMADVLGLGSDKVRAFTTALGGDKGLALDGLKPEEQQAKIAEALATANNELAQQVLGTWQATSEKVHKTIVTAFGSGEEASIAQSWETITTVITGTKYVTSEYAKEGEKAIDTLTRLATSLATTQDLWADMRLDLGLAGLAGADAASKIADAFGGLEAMTQQLAGYIDNYYSDAEKRENIARRASQALAQAGLTFAADEILSASRPIVRGFVEAVLSEFGPSSPQYVAAVQQANLLAGLYEPLGAAAASSAAAISDAMRRLQGDTASLQIDLLRAMGDTAGADAAQRALDTTGLTAAEVAVYDYNAALREQIKSLNSAADAAAELAASAIDFARATAGSQIQVDRVAGLAAVGNVAALQRLGIPGYAAGGDHAGGLRLVGENGPELEVTGPARIYNAQQTRGMLQGGGNNTARLEALLESMAAQVPLLRAEVRAVVTHTASVDRKLQRVMPDGDAIATREAPAL